jgi:hypothetical protein
MLLPQVIYFECAGCTAYFLAKTRGLIDFSGARDALIDGLAAGESLLGSMPVGDRFFAQPPAEQNDLSLDLTRKIKQANVEILDLHANGVDFGEGVFGALFGFGALGFATRQWDYIQKCSPVQKNALLQRLLLDLKFFDDFLGGDGGAQ